MMFVKNTVNTQGEGSHIYSPPSEDTFCFFIKKEMT